jgi:hypothetical protein
MPVVNTPRELSSVEKKIDVGLERSEAADCLLVEPLDKFQRQFYRVFNVVEAQDSHVRMNVTCRCTYDNAWAASSAHVDFACICSASRHQRELIWDLCFFSGIYGKLFESLIWDH